MLKQIYCYINKKLFIQSLIGIAVVFALSFISWQFPITRNYLTGLVALFFIVASVKDLRNGIYLIILELLIGVQGYVLAFELGSFSLSLRICLFIIWLSLFFAKVIVHEWSDFWNYFKAKWWLLLIPFFIIFFGVIQAVIHNIDYYAIFFDVNGFLFWFYAVPFLYLGLDKTKLLTALTAGIGWVILQSVVLLYTFGHYFDNLNYIIYHWLRDWRLIEVTEITLALYRIFMQNQIFLLIALALVIILIFKSNKLKVNNLFLLTTVFLGIIISFSRSMWLGLVVMLLALFIIGFSKKLKEILNFTWKNFFVYIISSIILSSVLWFGIAHLPLPYVDLSLLEDIDRFGLDAAANARLRMLEPLMNGIAQQPFLGHGFGKSLTYFTTDPRIVESSAGGSGEYTTFAFEWGYLDTALKVGMMGLLIYLGFLLKIVKDLFKNAIYKKQALNIGLDLALIGLLITNITTPYLNHPLGIGFIIIILLLSNLYERNRI